jgi:hypothetical protein
VDSFDLGCYFKATRIPQQNMTWFFEVHMQRLSAPLTIVIKSGALNVFKISLTQFGNPNALFLQVTSI